MNLSKFSVERPVTITMIVLIVLLFGILALTSLPIDLFPEIEYPIAAVIVTYQGASPQEIETLITEPLEDSLATIPNIEEINSTSSEGMAMVMAQFDFGTDMDFKMLDIREKVDLVKAMLPEDASDPTIIKADMSMMPVIGVSFSNKSGDLEGLKTRVEDEFSQNFERVNDVASVTITGGETKEITVKVNPVKLASYNLSIDRLSQVISADNINLPGGSVDSSGQELNIRVLGEFDDIEDVKKTPVTLDSGSVITLADVAEVSMDNKEVDSIYRVNGEETISISVTKQSGGNTVEVAEGIKKEAAELQRLNPNIDIQINNDTSEYIQISIDNVINNLLTGSLLAVIILYVFLKDLRTTLIIAVSIPFSLIASFILLSMNDITLNMMTLGGLALAVGMLVDNAIVVIENIYRFNVSGMDPKEAAIKGASEVAMAVTASTLTTIAVFLPISLVEGLVGVIFNDFALTVTLSLIASLVVALTFIPMLSSKLMGGAGGAAALEALGMAGGSQSKSEENEEDDEKEEKSKKKNKLVTVVHNVFDKIYEKVERFYIRILNRALVYKKITLGITIIFLLVSVGSFMLVGKEFIPSTDEGTINIAVDLPLGSKLEDTDNIIKILENKVKDIDEVVTIVSQVEDSSGSLDIELLSLSDRDRSTDDVSAEIRASVKDIAGADITIGGASTLAMASGGDIGILVKGDDLDVLRDISRDLKRIVEGTDGTVNVTSTLSDDVVPELEVKIDKSQAANYGLTTAQIASTVRTSMTGSTVTKLRTGSDEIDIVISGMDNLTKDLSSFEQLSISTPMGSNVPIGQLAELNIVDGPVSISRDNQEKVSTVSTDVVDRDLASVMEDIELKIDEYSLPEGYYIEYSGESVEMMEAFGQLSKALLVSVLLVYMIMAAQFESLLHPFIIMFIIPLAFAGGVLFLFVTRVSFGVTAFIGIIMLAGIVVNNGIVLIDYINDLRQDGYDVTEALKIAGPVRLRPILMTTLTTALGLVPLALGIGEGAELQQPMAVVVVGGLTISTLLTLIVIPVLYSSFEGIADKIRKKFKKDEDDEVVN